MAKNERLRRLIDLVPYITVNQGISIQQLANVFNVTIKELEEDLTLLFCCGLPQYTPYELMEIHFEDGTVTVTNASELSQPRNFSQGEIAALILGLDALKTNSEAAKTLRSKLASGINSNVLYQPTEADQSVSTLNAAIANSNLISFKYNGEIRNVIPIEVFRENSHVYLSAFCKNNNAPRTFRVDKIESLQTLETCEMPPVSGSNMDRSFTAKIKIKKQQRRAQELFGGTEAIVVHSAEWLIQNIMAFGGDVELVAPERDSVRQRAMAALQLYV